MPTSSIDVHSTLKAEGGPNRATHGARLPTRSSSSLAGRSSHPMPVATARRRGQPPPSRLGVNAAGCMGHVGKGKGQLPSVPGRPSPGRTATPIAIDGQHHVCAPPGPRSAAMPAIIGQPGEPGCIADRVSLRWLDREGQTAGAVAPMRGVQTLLPSPRSFAPHVEADGPARSPLASRDSCCDWPRQWLTR